MDFITFRSIDFSFCSCCLHLRLSLSAPGKKAHSKLKPHLIFATPFLQVKFLAFIDYIHVIIFALN